MSNGTGVVFLPMAVKKPGACSPMLTSRMLPMPGALPLIRQVVSETLPTNLTWPSHWACETPGASATTNAPAADKDAKVLRFIFGS
ncbi:hypothetical protein G6F32_016673 [Rhizopus arrhizus]|nr:hypothetical protein G6F32_016673 [Rhizopus arrhizus]